MLVARYLEELRAGRDPRDGASARDRRRAARHARRDGDRRRRVRVAARHRLPRLPPVRRDRRHRHGADVDRRRSPCCRRSLYALARRGLIKADAPARARRASSRGCSRRSALAPRARDRCRAHRGRARRSTSVTSRAIRSRTTGATCNRARAAIRGVRAVDAKIKHGVRHRAACCRGRRTRS